MDPLKALDIELLAIACATPDRFITSNEIEQDLSALYDRLKLPYGRIEMQTGIQTRGVFDDKMPSDIASIAAKNLFKQFNVDPKEIDAIIYTGVCRNFLEPTTVSIVHHELKLRDDCFSFDLSNACLGMLSAINISADMLNAGSAKKILLVTGENSRALLDQTIATLATNTEINRKEIKKYFANFTIGSAGVAMLLGKENNGLARMTYCTSLSDTSANDLCQGGGSQEALVMETNSEELMHKGVALAARSWQVFKNNRTKIADHYICHQVGIQHQKFLYQKLELDFKKDSSTFLKYGNTGSAALPLTLCKTFEAGKFNKHEVIHLLGIGSGLHTTMMEVLWN